jgi:hypothetical protein
MDFQTAVKNVSVASEEYRNAQQSVRTACADLLSLSPYKSGDIVSHPRYGKCAVFCVEAKPHPEYGALWAITALPYLKTGKPGARKISWLEKVILPDTQ